jgi:hypothetical protein
MVIVIAPRITPALAPEESLRSTSREVSVREERRGCAVVRVRAGFAARIRRP